MTYLRQKHNSCLVFGPSYPKIDMTTFKIFDWHDFYQDVKKAILPNTLEPRGKDIDLYMIVDSDHTWDKLTCCYETRS